jgi:MFS family permease
MGFLKMPRTWMRSLRHRNFRLYFLGQGVSLLGTWMQQTAMAWLVFRLTANEFLMGVNYFAGQIPSLVLLPVVGVLVDRWNRWRVVCITQTLAMLLAFLLAGLVFVDVIVIWQVNILAFALGCVNAFDLPARQALLPRMLDSKEDLSNAIALNSSVFNGARLVGPALAGLFVKLGNTGEAWCFLLNGVSFLAVLLSLAIMRVPRAPALARPGAVLEGFRDGWRYTMGHRPIRALLVLVATLGGLVMPYAVLLPKIASDVLHSGGTIYLASRPTIRGSASRIMLSSFLLAGCLAGFALSRDLALSLVFLTLVGANLMLVMVSCNTIVQSIVPDDKRGRVMSLYTLAFLGLTPFGGLLVGGIGWWWGSTVAVLGSAAGAVLAGLTFLPALPVVRAAIRAHLNSQQQPVPVPVPVADLCEEV